MTSPHHDVVQSDMVNARLDGAFETLGRVIDRTDILVADLNTAETRHAEVAALVQKLTVAVETLERKVSKLVELELKSQAFVDAIIGVEPGIDPPDIKDVPSVDWVRGPRGGLS